jgi:hypothetical protein
MTRIVAAALLLLALRPAFGAEVAATFDPACLPWDGARYQAQKLFLTVELDVEARMLDEPPLAALRKVEGRTPLMPGAETLALTVGTRGPGWRTLNGELLLDARSGGILQYTSLRQPSPRFRVYRFTDSGPERWTARPLGDELQAPPERWSDIDIKQRTYDVGRLDEPVLEVSTLLYLLASSPLQEPGQVMRVNGYATSADELYAVTVTVGEPVPLAVDYRVAQADGTAADRRGSISVLPLRVEGRARIPGGTAEGFDILGLHDVEFLLDPERRVVVALRARIPAVGGVQFQLNSLQQAKRPARCSKPAR